MKVNLAIGLVVGVMACAAAGTFGAVSAQEESQSDAVSAQAKSQWDGVYSADQASRGAAAYASRCSDCHAPDLTGNALPPSGGQPMDQLSPVAAPGLVGGDFAAKWNGVTLDQLFDRIRTSMPLDNPGSLNRQQTADILAFMLRNSTAPAGTDELSTQSEVLHTITYLATDPKAE